MHFLSGDMEVGINDYIMVIVNLDEIALFIYILYDMTFTGFTCYGPYKVQLDQLVLVYLSSQAQEVF